MTIGRIRTLCVLFYLFHGISVRANELDPATDYLLSFTEMMDKLRWNYEVHEVVTEDKYILQLFHLPGDKTKPVFLLSGNFGTADDYVARGNTSLPAVLLAAGYDVWLGNWRGCRYGRKHETLDPDRDDAFWDFSYHEFAKYDVPSHLDYVLNATRQSRVSCIGWSLGTTTFFVMGALRPEYVDKVAVFIAFAPFGFSYHSVTLTAFEPFIPLIEGLAKIFDVQEVAKYNSTVMTALRYVCCSEELGYNICMNIFNKICGVDETNLEREITPMIFGHWPSSSSMKALIHLAQNLVGHRIAQYDYGRSENLVRYGSRVAPNYPLYKNNMPIVLISGLNDMVSTLPDVEILKRKLPNVVEHIILEPPDFNHVDFAYGKNSYKTLYRIWVLNILAKYMP